MSVSPSIDPRFIALIFSVLAAVAAGTPYLYGVYSPQLINRCKISAESAATISFASNLGSGLGGFPAGLIIDKFGVRFSLLLGASCLFGGYSSLHYCYLNAISSLLILSISILFVGFGSIISYFSTLKVCTSNFPHHRGTAGAFAVSSFGLSALIFSAISAYWFSEDTEGLLRFLSLCCGITIAGSSFFIKLYNAEEIEELEHHDEEADLGVSQEVGDDTPTTIQRSQPRDINKSDSGLGAFLGAHRGSLAQINFNESATSLFSYASSLMSRSSSSLSSYNSVSTSPTKNQAIQVPSGTVNNINNTYFNSSPTSSRISGSPNTASSSSPLETLRAPFHHRNSSSKGIYFGVGGVSPRNSFSAPDKNTLKKEVLDKGFLKKDVETPPAVDEETPLIEPTPLRKLRKRKQPHSASGHVKNLVTNRLFLLHYLMLGLMSSIGQLYIYSVGFMVRALFNKREELLIQSVNSSKYLNFLSRNTPLVYALNGIIFFYSGSIDLNSLVSLVLMGSHSMVNTSGAGKSSPEAYQALQVSILAFGSFSGRLLWGPLSDLMYKKFKYQRLWLVLLSNILLIFGQIATLSINDVNKISTASILFGLGYGSIFGVYPAVIADQFGSKGFTTSWGLICTGPLVGLYFLTKIFGQNIDRMSELVDGEYMCIVGKHCYDEIFKINIGLCLFVAILMLGLMYQKRH